MFRGAYTASCIQSPALSFAGHPSDIPARKAQFCDRDGQTKQRHAIDIFRPGKQAFAIVLIAYVLLKMHVPFFLFLFLFIWCDTESGLAVNARRQDRRQRKPYDA